MVFELDLKPNQKIMLMGTPEEKQLVNPTVEDFQDVPLWRISNSGR